MRACTYGSVAWGVEEVWVDGVAVSGRWGGAGWIIRRGPHTLTSKSRYKGGEGPCIPLPNSHPAAKHACIPNPKNPKLCTPSHHPHPVTPTIPNTSPAPPRHAAAAGEYPRPELRAQARISGACMDAALGLVPSLTVKGTKHPTKDGTCT